MRLEIQVGLGTGKNYGEVNQSMGSQPSLLKSLIFGFLMEIHVHVQTNNNKNCTDLLPVKRQTCSIY